MPNTFTAQLDQLYFDPDNPRFITGFGNDQAKMFRYLIKDIGVDDLLQSISASGLIEGDPIIVRARDGGGYYVIEGNRRLAALKLLTGERPDDQEPALSVPELTSEDAAKLKALKVQSGWRDDLLQAYLGYKHVTAAREWPPEAKAKFVFERAGGDFSRENLTKFAQTLGTTFPTLKRWLVAFLTLREAEENNLFDPTSVSNKRYFGTFYTLLGGHEAQQFLNLQTDEITPTPVPQDHLTQLGEFVRWTIGTQEVRRAVNSRQQEEFEQVLSSPRALQHFRLQGDLEGSLLYTEYKAEEIAQKLRVAAYSVEECLPKLFDVRENSAVKEAFEELERAHTKARLNMRGDNSLTDADQ